MWTADLISKSDSSWSLIRVLSLCIYSNTIAPNHFANMNAAEKKTLFGLLHVGVPSLLILEWPQQLWVAGHKTDKPEDKCVMAKI